MKNLLYRAQEIGGKPILLLQLMAFFWIPTKAILRVFGIQIELARFVRANQIAFSERNITAHLEIEISLLFLSTTKDFPILEESLKRAVRSLSNYKISGIYLIVPDHEIEYLPNELRTMNNIYIFAESNYLSNKQVALIEKVFGSRKGWALQQILKYAFIIESSARGVLIVDSDTLLLSMRNWLDDENVQVLTPTWEYHPPYYEFLRGLGFEYDVPQFSFVSHHMLIQPSYYREAISKTQITDLDSLLAILIANNNRNENSPFSIDFEFYAQYMYKNYPEKIRLEKWANIHVPVSFNDFMQDENLNRKFLAKYASLSFHSYGSN